MECADDERELFAVYIVSIEPSRISSRFRNFFKPFGSIFENVEMGIHIMKLVTIFCRNIILVI